MYSCFPKIDPRPFTTAQNKGFGHCLTNYTYIILTPIDGETIVTPSFYLNGHEKTAHIEIKWETKKVKVRLVIGNELVYVKPAIVKIIISQDDKSHIAKFKFNKEDMDKESWIEFVRPNFDKPLFIHFAFYLIYHKLNRKLNKTIPLKVELSERLKRLYKDKIYADFLIKVGSIEFLTHKSVLSARSPVFADLLNKNTEQQDEMKDVLVINEIEPKIFEIFLKYLYQFEIDTIENSNINLIVSLLQLAITYKVDDFKLELCKLATNSFTPENIHEWIQHSSNLKLEYIRTVAVSCLNNCVLAQIPPF
ncbi:PREDICTED: uncharacterized protein LOC107064884 [Polistes dominula]|uniref:Uncharacterized protein LOC107064884 n=1 Tax=Polistes dominula TaxID=743375 RepID=A0ABM1I000_POLDO|nr:PREDICTED: uncharacterized protein LOC107064884 [Polistes dominula]